MDEPLLSSENERERLVDADADTVDSSASAEQPFLSASTEGNPSGRVHVNSRRLSDSNVTAYNSNNNISNVNVPINNPVGGRRNAAESVSAGITGKTTEGGGYGLLVSFICMIFVGLGNKLFQVFQTIPMHNYPFFLSVLSTFVYIPTSFAYIWIFPSHISQEARNIPKLTFAVMGFYDAVSGVMLTFAVNFITKRTLVILLQQTAIPISMLISRIALGTRYNVFQYTGAFVVIIGLLVVLAPTDSDKQSDSNTDTSSELLWMAVLVLSNVPTCLSTVYKERALGEIDINVVYLNGWVALYQFLVSLPMVIPAAPLSDLAIEDIPKNMQNGMLCFLGQNSIVNFSSTVNSSTDLLTGSPKYCYDINDGRNPVCDDCSMGPIYVTVYLIFNIAYNICLVCILKYGDSNILWLSMTFMVPLCNFVFYMPSVPGHVQPKLGDLIGLLVICLGLFCYRFAKSWSKRCCRRYRLSRALMESPRTMFHNQEKETEAIKRMANHITLGNVNNVEVMQTVVQATASQLEVRLQRTPVQIRNAYLHRLGLDIRDSPTQR